MKTYNKFQKWGKWVTILTVFSFVAGLYSCTDDDVQTPIIESVRSTNNPDSTFTASVPGAVVIIHGKGFGDIKKVYFNEEAAAINLAFSTETDVIITIPANTPLKGTANGITNLIRLVTDHGEATYSFDVKAAKPTIISISNEMAAPGSKITLFGSNFLAVKNITFPDNLVVTDFVVSEDATSCEVTVPTTLTKSGNITLETESGVAIYKGFRDVSHLICNFDNKSPWGYWGCTVTNSSDKFPDYNDGKFAILSGVGINPNDFNVWGSRIIPMNTCEWITAPEMANSIADYAFKFEIRVKGFLNSGAILVNPGGAWGFVAVTSPWYVSGQRTNFAPSDWTTITIPMTNFKNKNAASTGILALDGFGSSMSQWSDLLDSDGWASLQMSFINTPASNIKPDAATATNADPIVIENLNIAIDNIRIVKIK